jgi:hypothetical protein
MINKYGYILLMSTLSLLVACAPESTGNGDDDDHPGGDASQPIADANDPNQGFIDSAVIYDAPMSTIDAGNVYPDAASHPDGGCAATACPNPNQPGCGPTEICGNGSDDNCNGSVDESCPCQAGAVEACFASPPGFRNKGGCMDGHQTCEGSGEFAHWGACTGGITPHAEACDSVDNDCNGCVDDDPLCCEVDLMCPSSMPDGSPFTDYVINGTTFYSGAVSTWKWEVTGGPCDQLLAPHVSYTLNGTQTTVVQGATLSTLTFHPTLSGDYTVHVTMTLPNGGGTYECTFIVHIVGPGLRVELCWDTTGSDDIDLHLHQPDSTAAWFTTTGTGPDCHYQNCKASSFTTAPNWGIANSPLAECVGGPEGPSWQGIGFCRNPRLDLDNIFTVGKPENINVDKPANNKTYRVAVHHYSGSGPSHPLVNIYCGGKILASYGKAPDLVAGFTDGGGLGSGPIWRVVDVKTHVDAAGNTTSCDLTQLHAAGQTAGYNVTCPGDGVCSNNAY